MRMPCMELHANLVRHPLLQQQRLTDGGPVVGARAAVTMATSADLEVEWAIDAVLLRSKDASKMVGHVGGRAGTALLPKRVLAAVRWRKEESPTSAEHPHRKSLLFCAKLLNHP